MYTSYTLNGQYKAQPASTQVHKDAENIQEFASLDELQASDAYIDYRAAQEAVQKAADYANLDKIVKQKQIDLGMDLSKENLVLNAALLSNITGDPMPAKNAEAFVWLQNLWNTKYNNVQEGDSVSFDDIEPMPYSYKELQTELGF